MDMKRDVAGACLVAATTLSSAAWAAGPGATESVMAQSGQHAATALPSIVVTPTASARSEADAPASVSVIEGDTLRQRPVNDLADALRDIPGVSLESEGLGRRGISIRGMSPDHTLMLVDGQRINASSSAIAHSDFELGWLPTEAIERVEVVRGPMSSLYGSDAMGGVVNVITRSATDQWHGSFSSYAQINDHGLNGNQYKSGIYVGGPIVPGRVGLNVWGEYRRRDALKDAGNTTLTALDAQRARTGHVGLTLTPDTRQRIDVLLDAGNEEQEGTRGATRGPAYQAENVVQRRRYSLSHAGDWDWGSSKVSLYRSILNREARRSDGAAVTGPNRFTDTVLDGRVGVSKDSAHRLTFGAQARRERLEDPSVNRKGVKALTHYAFMAQDEILLAQQWELLLGGRLDHHEDFGWEASPRAYLVYRPSDTLTFKAGAARGFKAPSLKQLSPEYESRAAMGGRGIIRGNPDLQPETNQSFELGTAYTQRHWSASATLFHNDVRNLIETVRQASCNERGRVCLEYENIARTRLQGLELEGSVDLSRQWRLGANYTYLDARDRTTGERLDDRSRHRANTTLTWTPLAQLATRMQLEYTGSQQRAASAGVRPAYLQLHWYVDYDLNREVSLHAGVENITDRRLANDDAGVYGRADEGRRFFAGVTAKF